MLYPYQKHKQIWDLFIALLLLITCVYTPIDIAFQEKSSVGKVMKGGDIFNIVTDLLFLVDIFVNFNSAFYDEDMEVIDDRKRVVKNYVTSWFVIDFLAIFPFTFAFGSEDSYNSLIRITRLGKITRIIKLMKILRILKVIKNQQRLMKYMNEYLRIGIGFERIFFFLLIFFIACHIVACLFIACAQFYNDDDGDFTGTWIEEFDQYKNNSGTIYEISLYWTITTITTVGYGDISGHNLLERMFCILTMIIGVAAFSFVNGSLASIFQSMDTTKAELNERIAILERIAKAYNIPEKLKIRMVRQMGFNANSEFKEVQILLDNLPPKLKQEVSLYIYNGMFQTTTFLADKDQSFVSWICPLLIPKRFEENEIIFNQNEQAEDIFFLQKGDISYVVPVASWKPIRSIKQGEHFGIIDIVASIYKQSIDMTEWYKRKEQIRRVCTVLSVSESEVLHLHYENVRQMEDDYIDEYQELFLNAKDRLIHLLNHRIKCLRETIQV